MPAFHRDQGFLLPAWQGTTGIIAAAFVLADTGAPFRRVGMRKFFPIVPRSQALGGGSEVALVCRTICLAWLCSRVGARLRIMLRIVNIAVLAC